MSVLRVLKIINALINTIGSLFIWYYVIRGLEIGLKFIEIKMK